ncbi:hypothetical protein JCM3765_000890 [Sporobolomyces pararoseus]
MSDSETCSSSSSSSPRDSIRVIWRTGPTQKPSILPTNTSTPISTSKRCTKNAGLASPSSITTLGEPPLREQKKIKNMKNKKKKSFTRQASCSSTGGGGGRGGEIPMDQKTLQLVSQLAMKVHQRSQPTSISRGSGVRVGVVTSTRSKSCTELTTPLRSRTSKTPTSPSTTTLVPQQLNFSSSKSSILKPPTISTTKSPSHLSPLPRTTVSKQTSTTLSKPSNNRSPPPPPRIVKGKEKQQEEEEEEDYDSYFEDFKDDGTLELALSQIEHRLEEEESIKQSQQQQQQLQGITTSTTSSTTTTKTAKVFLEEEIEKTRTRRILEEKRKLTEELARKELESIGNLEDWGSEDEDF